MEINKNARSIMPKIPVLLRILLLIALTYFGFMLLIDVSVSLWLKIPIALYIISIYILSIRENKILDTVNNILELFILGWVFAYSLMNLNIITPIINLNIITPIIIMLLMGYSFNNLLKEYVGD